MQPTDRIRELQRERCELQKRGVWQGRAKSDVEILQLKRMQNNITVSADFGGGLDLVFDGKTEIKLEIGLPATVSSVIRELADRHANHKKDMFAINGIIRPGILVLINDADWELSEKEETVLEKGDKVSFISTLHGG